MLDYGTVLEAVEVPVYLADYGIHTTSLMVATLYRLPYPQLVLAREILMPNAIDATVTYTLISGDTLEGWKRNLAEMDSMLWRPLTDPTHGPRKK